jgi:hypothetical protein
MFLFCSFMPYGDGAPFRSAVFGRSLGRQRPAYRGARRTNWGLQRRASAYDEAIRRRPGKIITLRQKARVLADSRRDR